MDERDNSGDRFRQESLFVLGSGLAVVSLVAATLEPTPSREILGVGCLCVIGVLFGYQFVLGPRSIPSLVGTVGVGAVVIGGTWGLLRMVVLWQVAILLLLLVSILSYGLARVQQVTLSSPEGTDGN